MALKIYDIETYSNCFTFVAKTPDEKDYDIFVIFTDPKGDEHIHQGAELYEYLQSNNHVYVGYNNISFDAPIVEEIFRRKGKITAEEIYQLAQENISGENRPLPFYKFKTRQIDLFKMWSFDTAQRRCSLKWLEFTMRLKKLKDLPYHHSKAITARQVAEVIKYNKYDVDVTLALYNMSEDKMELRKTLYAQYKDFQLFSRGDTSLGADTFLIDLADQMNISVNDLRKRRTFYDELYLDDVILHDRIKWIKDPEFKKVIEAYSKVVLRPDEEGILQLGGAITQEIIFDGVKFKYGTGGLHASVDDKLFIADDDHLIIDVDVASFYPNIAIVNKLHPKHLSTSFVKLYKQLYDERKQIPKSDPMNLAKKLSLNSIFGKSNSRYSYLYDTAFTLGITINGQLMLSMLAEQLARCSSIIQVNTDGVTVMVHKSQKDLVDKVIKWWEKKTGLVLEAEQYKQMAISDVNNYHAIYMDGKVKRKGKYAIYSDYTNPKLKDYHKNPSALAIPEAVDKYLIAKTPVTNTIYAMDDIHEFLIGFKKKSNFEFLLAKVKESGYIELKKNADRVIRYYVAQDGASVYKLTNKQGLTTLAKNVTLQLAQIITNPSLDRFPDLNKEWYIEQAQEWIDSMELVDNAEFIKDKFVK